MSFKNRIDAGLAGDYQGLDNGFDKLNNFLYGIQRKWYYLIGGLSNTAKTTLVDFMVMNAIRDAELKGIELNIFYYSYEIDEESKKCVWLSNHIFNKYRLSIPPEKIAGFGDNRLSKIEEEIVNKEIPYIDKIFERINFRYDPINPTGIYKELMDHFNKIGKFNYETYNGVDEYGNQKEMKRIVSYTPNNLLAYNIVVHDHIALTKIEKKYTLKENLDKLSEYYVWLRNLCGLTIFAIQQFNQTLNSVERKKYSGIDLSPQQNDFKDSGNPFQDCDTACGVMNPKALDMDSWGKFNVKKMGDHFRVFKIIKNRKGRTNISCPLYFNPKAGFFKELPDGDIVNKDLQMLEEISRGLWIG